MKTGIEILASTNYGVWRGTPPLIESSFKEGTLHWSIVLALSVLVFISAVFFPLQTIVVLALLAFIIS